MISLKGKITQNLNLNASFCLSLIEHIIKVFRKGKIPSLVQWNPTVIAHSNVKEKSKIRFVHTAHVMSFMCWITKIQMTHCYQLKDHCLFCKISPST